jgi:hypothetical protein
VVSPNATMAGRGMKKPGRELPGAIPTVDFILPHFAMVVKKVVVKN